MRRLGAVLAGLAAVAAGYAVWLFAGDNPQGGRDEVGALALAVTVVFALGAIITLAIGRRRSHPGEIPLGR
jgi:drug/metabolite transporter superfamily protein YnfA